MKSWRYKHYHSIVAKKRGRPSFCEKCGRTDTKITYNWASMTKDYANIFDYVRLCRSCHCYLDGFHKNLGSFKNGANRETCAKGGKIGYEKGLKRFERPVIRSDGKIFRSGAEAARFIGVNQSTLWDTLNGKQKQTKGWRFNYADR